MPTPTLDPAFHQLVQERHIATLGTTNADGSIHLTAVWYLFEDGSFYVGTSSKSRKARNLTTRPNASLMIDTRKQGTERGVTATGTATIISGDDSRQLNHRLHARYMSTAAMSDPGVGGIFAAIDDVTLKITPASWFTWDMAELDAQVFAGKIAKSPGYLLPLD
jgi:PPOX class probable F420-dependent enzyme